MGDIRDALRERSPLDAYERKLPEYYTRGDFEITRSDRGHCWHGDESPGGVIIRTVTADTPEECAKLLEVR